QAVTDQSTDRVLTATGTLNSARYREVLWPGHTVGLRGAGWDHDGLYLVRSVSHELRRGSYTQRFTPTRERLGSPEPTVPLGGPTTASAAARSRAPTTPSGSGGFG